MTELADQTRASLQTAPGGESEVVLSVRNVSKKFCKKLRRSMAYGIADLAQNLIGLKPDSTTLRKDEFWAVENMDFQLRRGEVLGLIGVNGSGKTTLLRLLAGIFPPDQGEIMLRGRVGALIALGAGFHPHFTGRENVYFNGAILGLSRDELDAHFA
jgi:lipopolysaccharide transport system ATP-binding protein